MRDRRNPGAPTVSHVAPYVRRGRAVKSEPRSLSLFLDADPLDAHRRLVEPLGPWFDADPRPRRHRHRAVGGHLERQGEIVEEASRRARVPGA